MYWYFSLLRKDSVITSYNILAVHMILQWPVTRKSLCLGFFHWWTSSLMQVSVIRLMYNIASSAVSFKTYFDYSSFQRPGVLEHYFSILTIKNVHNLLFVSHHLWKYCFLLNYEKSHYPPSLTLRLMSMLLFLFNGLFFSQFLY